MASSRRRRQYILRIAIIIFGICLFFHIKYNIISHSEPNNRLIQDFLNNNVIHAFSNNNLSLKETTLNCSGDPAKQWCAKEIKLCDPYLIVYNDLFIVTRSIILQPSLAKGKRIGGENIQDVLNQPEQDEYFQFEKGFIKIPCDVSQFNGRFPNGHLPTIFSSLTSSKTDSYAQTVNETTIAVRRQDYVNFYHTITDLYTVYLLCRFFQQDPKLVRILFIDAHPKGNLDILWSQLFHSYTRLGHLKTVPSIFYRELIFSQPQPKSEIDILQDRRVAPSFFPDFREHVLQQFNITYQTNPKVNCQSLNIFFLVRHNYVAHPRNPSGKITRTLPNEKETLDELKLKFSNYTNINFTSNHFEELGFVEQLRTVIETDILIGIHGAGLTHTIFMKSNRVLIEISSSVQGGKHFDLFASMNNMNYQLCSIIYQTTAQSIFNCIMKEVLKICPR